MIRTTHCLATLILSITAATCLAQSTSNRTDYISTASSSSTTTNTTSGGSVSMDNAMSAGEVGETIDKDIQGFRDTSPELREIDRGPPITRSAISRSAFGRLRLYAENLDLTQPKHVQLFVEDSRFRPDFFDSHDCRQEHGHSRGHGRHGARSGPGASNGCSRAGCRQSRQPPSDPRGSLRQSAYPVVGRAISRNGRKLEKDIFGKQTGAESPFLGPVLSFLIPLFRFFRRLFSRFRLADDLG